MPYTAPSKQSLGAQHSIHPRSDSHCPSDSAGSPHKPSGRPHLPRSYSSTSYVRRHRRSPSTSKSLILPVVESSKPDHGSDPHSSLRQSPPPVSNAAIPPGAIISPPESGANSSDEEAPYQKREGIKIQELEAAVRSIEQRREPSPERQTPAEKPGAMAPSSSSVHPSNGFLPLSRTARKISHSRSSTEGSIVSPPEEALNSSPDETDRDDEPKPPMLRKKSGELVRPALRPPSARRRPSSMPGTPTYSKAVHFDSQLEHIRHFLQLDKPLAVSAETSPVDDHNSDDEFPFGHNEAFEWELRLSNFPKDSASRALQPVRLERLYLSSDKSTLVGVVAVANLAFHKHVVARFTFDYWKTVSEVTADYSHDVRRKQAHDGYDRFTFNIKLADQANLESKTMFACIRYSVGGREYWDNNNTMNYEVAFLKTPKPKPEKRNLPTSTSRPALPRSRSSVSISTRPHSMPSAFDDFSGVDNYLSFGRPKKSGPNGVSHLSPKVSNDNDADDHDAPKPREKQKQSRQAFGNRYDFGASLSAAMRSKTNQDRTTLTAKAKSGKPSSPDAERKNADKKMETGLLVDKASPTSDISRQVAHSGGHSRPSSLASSKPHHESSVYKELVDKYCFYGTPQNSLSPKDHSVSTEDAEPDRNSSPSVSPTSPASPHLSPQVDSARSRGSRSSSTSPSLSPRASPVSFGYPYHSMQRGFLTESQTPAAIRG